MKRVYAAAALMMALAGCNTYYDPSDPYVRGLRFYDRGMAGVARQIWEPLVTQGDCDAETGYARVLFQQSDIPRNQPAALAMMKTSAERGQPLAQLSLASLYYMGGIPHAAAGGQKPIVCEGCGLEADPVQSMKWALIGRKNAVYSVQSDFADKLLPILKREMTAQQIATAEQEAAAWRPTGPTCKPRSLW